MITLELVFAVITTVLTLANIFQWFDHRSKNKALQSFLEAIHDISKRLEGVSDGPTIKQKSQDICSVVNAAIVTVGGYKKPFFNRIKKGGA
ncbi:MAG: hypothetical protein HYY55_01720 [Candidatus Niyogibacteria bacterium]|nr:MAG: hypothetical protein HYY55_01720 [Candidatus Niyogibacteria bacterium]